MYLVGTRKSFLIQASNDKTIKALYTSVFFHSHSTTLHFNASFVHWPSIYPLITTPAWTWGLHVLVTVSSMLNITQCLFVLSLVELQTKVCEYFTITEKTPTMYLHTTAFSWLKVPNSGFTFNTLSRHYAKQALIVGALSVIVKPSRTSG